jgi:hypothetical protein
MTIKIYDLPKLVGYRQFGRSLQAFWIDALKPNTIHIPDYYCSSAHVCACNSCDMVFQRLLCSEELFQEKTSQAATEQRAVQNAAHVAMEQKVMLNH